MANPEQPTDYQLLKETAGITTVVKELYPRLMADNTTEPPIRVHFDGLDIGAIQGHMVSFISMATGGPGKYDGDLSVSHQHLDITGPQYDRTRDILVDVLNENNAPEAVVQRLGGALMGLRPGIVKREV